MTYVLQFNDNMYMYIYIVILLILKFQCDKYHLLMMESKSVRNM